jgi:hypothetical protein
MVDKAAVKSILNELGASPLFYLFVASKELFHSNFLHWLSLVNQKEFLKLVSPDFRAVGEVSILREERVAYAEHKATLDFLISNSEGESVAIENKVKDYPERQQLLRIANSFGDSVGTKLILLTLFKHEGLSFPNWQILTYGNLSKKIIPEAFTENTYYRLLIGDYKLFTYRLASLAEVLKPTNEYDFAIAHDHELFDLLNKYKLWEAYQKIRASHMLSVYMDKYKQDGVQTNYGVNNQRATVNFYVEIQDSKSLGIQIENDQYRSFVRSKSAASDIAKLLAEGIFFRKDFRSSQKQQPYLNYGAGFKYQFDRMTGAVAFDLMFRGINDELKENVLNNLDRIRQVLL